MCGIAGIISADTRRVTKSYLQLMANALLHRGPDGEGYWINEPCTTGFAHRRLAIIDLSSAGAQPMHYYGRYTITYNGEIYNYIEVRNSLLKQGYSFISNTDTEVLIAAYVRYGEDCLRHLDGMFSFAIWDQQEQLLFCARDRFGEKPFYYHYDIAKSYFAFASEMKALWAAGISKEADEKMIFNYFTLGWVKSPLDKNATFYRNILSLPPAHQLTLKFRQDSIAGVDVKPYWSVAKKRKVVSISLSDAAAKLREMLSAAIKLRLRSDVPLGTSLSGGLDSSSIAATISILLGSNSQQKTFSAVFPGFERDESRQIADFCKLYSVQHFTTTPNAADFIETFDELMYSQEEPFQSASVFAQYKVYELARQNGVTVVLDGQGADEVFAGYPKYHRWYLQQLIKRFRFKALRSEIKSNNALTPSELFRNGIAAFFPTITANVLEKRAWKLQRGNTYIAEDFQKCYADRTSVYKPAIHSLDDILYYNTFEFGLEELLRYADRSSMAHGREVRLPFLDHHLVEFAFTLPANFKICNGYTKKVLRESMDRVLPRSISWEKKKIGFEPPQAMWMADNKVKERILESRRKLVANGIFQKDSVNLPLQTLEAHAGNNFDFRSLCVAALL